MFLSWSTGPMNITLFGKRNFADVIKLKILKWRDYPEYRWVPCNHIGSHKKDVGGVSLRRDCDAGNTDRSDVL